MRNTANQDKIDTLVEWIEDFHLLPTNPMVSICVTTYNHEKFIHQTLDGILMQEVNFSYEILVADDHSKDSTREIVIAYQKKHPDKIRLRLARENLYSLGCSPSGTVRVKCRGTYIALCEGDDYWIDPLKLQKQVDFLEENQDYVGCYHGVKRIFENNPDKEEIWAHPDMFQDITIHHLLMKNPAYRHFHPDVDQKVVVHTSSAMYQAEIFKSAIYDTVMFIDAGDKYLQAYALTKGKLKTLPEVMSVYRYHSQGLTRVISQEIKKTKGCNIITRYEAIRDLHPAHYHEIEQCITSLKCYYQWKLGNKASHV